ncbi:MAG: PAS domain-containing protein [Bacteroidota bacterium]
MLTTKDMNAKDLILGKNMELLLAETLVRNQELEKNHEDLLEKYSMLENSHQSQTAQFDEINTHIKSSTERFKELSSELLRAQKALDVKGQENKRLMEALDRSRDELKTLSQDRATDDRHALKRLESQRDELSTKYHQAEEALQILKSESKIHESIVSVAKVATWKYHVETNTIQFAPALRELVDDSRFPLVWDFNLLAARIHPEDQHLFENMVLQGSDLADGPQIVRFLESNRSYRELQFFVLDGKKQSDIEILGCLVPMTKVQDTQPFEKKIEEHLSQIAYKDEEIQQLKKKLQNAQSSVVDIERLGKMGRQVDELTKEVQKRDRLLKNAEEEREVAEEIIQEKERELKQMRQSVEESSKDSQEFKDVLEELNRTRKESANLSLAASQTQNAVVITDGKGCIEYVNTSFLNFTGYTSDQVIGKSAHDFPSSQKSISVYFDQIAKGIQSKKQFTEEVESDSSTSGLKYLSVSTNPILDEGQSLEKLVLIVEDITGDKKRQSELEETEEEMRKLMESQFIQSEELIEKEKQLSEALEESERIREEIENLSMVASRTDNAVIITDVSGSILYVNDGFERITEYSKEEVLGKKPGTFLQGPGTNPDHKKKIREGLNSKKPFKQEILNYSKSGKPYWLNIAINPIFDEQGEVEKYIAIENDITEQKEREAEYANLSLVASKTDNAVIITDRHGLIEWVNPGFEKVTEYTLEEVLGKKPGTFLQGPETSKEDVRKISQGIKSEKPFRHEVYNYSKSGRGYWLSLSITPVFNQQGIVEKYIAIESDITAEKAAQAEMENLSLVASRTDNAVIITDKHGLIEWVNEGFIRLTEYSFEEVKGQKPGTFLQGEKTSQDDVMAIRRGINSQKPFKHQVYNYSKSGRGYWLSLSITPIFDLNGEVEKYIAIETDITAQKESELELENLSLVASKTDNAVIITDDKGGIEWVNQSFVSLTEYTLDEVRGSKPGTFLQGAETREEDVIAIRKGIKSQKPFTAEIYNYSKSGKGYWLSLSITPIFDQYGILEKFIAIERDITEDRRLAAEIEDSEKQIRMIMDEQFENQEKMIQQEQELKRALEESKILSLVASKTDNAVIVSSKEGLIQYVNAGFEKITGYTFEEVKGKKPGSFLQGPETSEADVQAIRDGLLSRKPFTQEILNYSKTGKPYWLSLSITPILDELGEVEQYIAIESDISERKAAEDELENLSLVASKTDNAVIITNQNGLIEWVNEGFEHITEYKFEEVVGKKPGNFLQGEETTEEQVSKIREGLDSRKPFTSEIYNYSKSGKGYWLSLSITPIFDDAGKIEKYIAIETDITERKTLEIEIQESEEQMRTLMDQQFSSSEELMKKEEELNQALEDEKLRKKELDDAMGRLKETQSQIVQSEKMASLGQLTAGIAHEINNPINFVYNGIDSLNMSVDDLTKIMTKYNELENSDIEKIPEILSEIGDMKKRLRFEKLMSNLPTVLSDIKSGANRTIEIVKGLRVFSRLDEEDQKAANINECLDSTLILLRNKTKDKIKVQKFFDQSLGDIMCFPGQLNQVFMNLLSNAVQAMPEDKNDGKIMIYTENLEKSVIIRIMDNGAGIPEDVKKRIFEPFFTTKPVGIGTGLGLSISYGIIEKHDGKIYVNSEVGKGTEFVIDLPKESAKATKTIAS